jgi:hypothetical protein
LPSGARTTAVITVLGGKTAVGQGLPAQQFQRFIAVGVIQVSGLSEDL